MSKALLKALRVRWRSYRHRFVPWIALNLQKNTRTLRQVKGQAQDKIIPDEEVTRVLVRFFTELLKNEPESRHETLQLLPAIRRELYRDAPRGTGLDPGQVMLEVLGFSIERKRSSLQSAGSGVFLTRGHAEKGSVIALYPGTVYEVNEPVLFQSMANAFLFRCADGVMIDGSDRGLSKVLYRSCSGRDRLGPFLLSDSSWLTSRPLNPLAVGQYVNNCSNDRAANVCYQELDVAEDFPLELRQFLPNVKFRADSDRPLRLVVLVSLARIKCGDELFSNYFTVIQ